MLPVSLCSRGCVLGNMVHICFDRLLHVLVFVMAACCIHT